MKNPAAVSLTGLASYTCPRQRSSFGVNRCPAAQRVCGRSRPPHAHILFPEDLAPCPGIGRAAVRLALGVLFPHDATRFAYHFLMSLISSMSAR